METHFRVYSVDRAELLRKTTLSELESDALESFESLRRKLVDNLRDVKGFRNLGKLDISINLRDIVHKKSFCTKLKLLARCSLPHHSFHITLTQIYFIIVSSIVSISFAGLSSPG